MPTSNVLEKWVPSLTQRQNYAWQPSHPAQQAGLCTIPSTRISLGGGALIFFKRKLGVLFPVSLKVQSLQIASLNLVPCVVGGGHSGPSDESTPQSLGQRKHQWSHKPPTVQRKTRLLQRRTPPPLPPQLKGPLATGMKGREGE